ncbi:MAG: hypothetical protein OXI90_00965 [Gammaproteobacteria bacterium]|nr:hypothetical protein [Gammaproteobacteria bacterium]
MEEIVKTAPNRRQRRPSQGMFWLLALLWLPMAIAATAVVRGFGLPLEPQAWLSLVVIAPCGLPLAFAWSSIHGLGYPRTAGSVCGIFAIATAVLSLVAGLLGPIGIAAYAIVLSLPAWVLYAILRLRLRKEFAA